MGGFANDRRAVFAARNGASRKRKLASAMNGVNFMRELYEHNAIKRRAERKFNGRRIMERRKAKGR